LNHCLAVVSGSVWNRLS